MDIQNSRLCRNVVSLNVAGRVRAMPKDVREA